MTAILNKISRYKKAGKTISFVSGNFNIIHPGHMRFLLFAAEQADVLIVGLYDLEASISAYFENDERQAALEALSCVNYVVIINHDLEQWLLDISPDIVVKGKEFEVQQNVEATIVKEYGGKLIFSSGEKQFSSRELLSRQANENSRTYQSIQKYHQRYNLEKCKLIRALDDVSKLRVAVFGDLIVDEYQECLPIGMSQEDPTIAVSPLEAFKYVGGAGIVSAHAASLGANVDFYSVCGLDKLGEFARTKLDEYGVFSVLLNDSSRPTTHKLRYRAKDKTLLRVNNFRRHDISNEIICNLVDVFKDNAKNYDVVIFADFSFGVTCPKLINQISEICKNNQIDIVADSQTSSQIGDLTKFKDLLLTTPTEIEARQASKDDVNGLIKVSADLAYQLNAANLIVTLGGEGILIRHQGKELETDNLPAFSETAIDTAGAGDAFLVTTSLMMKAGLNIWRAAFMGNVAAAVQVNTRGNIPLKKVALTKQLDIYLK